jgi:molecular chaperone GrpE
MPSSHETDVSRGAEETPGEELAAELDRTRAQLARAEDRYLRSRADLENYRKRADRELERRVRERGDQLLAAWLDVVDSVERALALAQHDAGTAADLRAFLDQMEAVLRRQGVTRIGAVGEVFDPELHEAVAVVPGGDHEPGTIAQVARSGYSADDRVLRPAQVTVAAAVGPG